MATKLIRLEDGTLVEVEVMGNNAHPIANSCADRVNASFSKIKPVLITACRPVIAAIKEIRQEVELEQVEVELGLSFEGEGNIYIAKASISANVTVRMTLKNME